MSDSEAVSDGESDSVSVNESVIEGEDVSVRVSVWLRE